MFNILLVYKTSIVYMRWWNQRSTHHVFPHEDCDLRTRHLLEQSPYFLPHLHSRQYY